MPANRRIVAKTSPGDGSPRGRSRRSTRTSGRILALGLARGRSDLLGTAAVGPGASAAVSAAVEVHRSASAASGLGESSGTSSSAVCGGGAVAVRRRACACGCGRRASRAAFASSAARRPLAAPSAVALGRELVGDGLRSSCASSVTAAASTSPSDGRGFAGRPSGTWIFGARRRLGARPGSVVGGRVGRVGLAAGRSASSTAVGLVVRPASVASARRPRRRLLAPLARRASHGACASRGVAGSPSSPRRLRLGSSSSASARRVGLVGLVCLVGFGAPATASSGSLLADSPVFRRPGRGWASRPRSRT